MRDPLKQLHLQAKDINVLSVTKSHIRMATRHYASDLTCCDHPSNPYDNLKITSTNQNQTQRAFNLCVDIILSWVYLGPMSPVQQSARLHSLPCLNVSKTWPPNQIIQPTTEFVHPRVLHTRHAELQKKYTASTKHNKIPPPR